MPEAWRGVGPGVEAAHEGRNPALNNPRHQLEIHQLPFNGSCTTPQRLFVGRQAMGVSPPSSIPAKKKPMADKFKHFPRHPSRERVTFILCGLQQVNPSNKESEKTVDLYEQRLSRQESDFSTQRRAISPRRIVNARPVIVHNWHFVQFRFIFSFQQNSNLLAWTKKPYTTPLLLETTLMETECVNSDPVVVSTRSTGTSHAVRQSAQWPERDL